MEDMLQRLVFDEGLTLETVRDLRWQDIQWDVRAVILRAPCARRCLIGLALDASEEILRPHRHLDESTLNALTSLRQRDIMRKIRMGLSWYPSEPVLTTREGHSLSCSGLQQWRDGLISHASGPEWGATPPFGSSR